MNQDTEEWFFDVTATPFEELGTVFANSVTKIAAAAVVIVFSLNDLYREIIRFRSRRI